MLICLLNLMIEIFVFYEKRLAQLSNFQLLMIRKMMCFQRLTSLQAEIISKSEILFIVEGC